MCVTLHPSTPSQEHTILPKFEGLEPAVKIAADLDDTKELIGTCPSPIREFDRLVTSSHDCQELAGTVTAAP